MSPAKSTLPPAPGKRLWLKPTLTGVVILLCGILIGSGLTSLVLWERMSRDMRHPRFTPERISEMIIDRYDLDDEQRVRIRAILDSNREQFLLIRDRFKPAVDSLIVDAREKVAEVLGPENADRWRRDFEEFRRQFPGPPRDKERRHDEDRRRDRRPPPPPPPPAPED